MFATLPQIGFRIIKTAIAVGLCLAIHLLVGGEGTPIFSSVAAIICMQPQVENSLTVSINRIIGTVIGAIFGLMVSLLYNVLPWDGEWLRYFLVTVTIIPVMYTTLLIKKPGAAALACVALISVNLSVGMGTPFECAWNRSVETSMGVLVCLAVNVFQLPRRREKDILFVSGFDDAIFMEGVGISPYSMFELNEVLRQGLAFTIATERTPANLMADLQEIHLKHPIIAMDGAVLYDMEQKRYLKCRGLSTDMVVTIEKTLKEMDVHYFLNVVWQDVLLIYHKDFKNEEEKRLYERARLSPHRNYVYGDHPNEGTVVYFLVVVPEYQANKIEQALQALDTKGELHFIREYNEISSGYCSLKIYNARATKEEMLKYLRKQVPQKKLVVFGGKKSELGMMELADVSYATEKAVPEIVDAADYRLRGHLGDEVVRKVFHLYEPLIWQKLPIPLRNPKGKK
ncbi:HAD hydrolase family protein [Chakrabartyella piscis]|uniref:HAD hydrolase family protein n=1 Tax=Chakrabartyella piscis TaxID=2918914 RepID=UPI00295856D4|nr:HAD hydrolase family protein [Chakrabartyella piscis]